MNRCLLVLWFACLPAWSATLVLDPAKSRVSFTYQQMGSDVEGEFKRYKANIEFDIARPEAGHVVVIIDPVGVDAGHPDANTELLRSTFFDVPASRRRVSNLRALNRCQTAVMTSKIS